MAVKKKQTHITVRFDTKVQVERIKKAAKARGWSFNQFVVTTSTRWADKCVAVDGLAEGFEEFEVRTDLPNRGAV